jgi:hypothetical protein
MMVIENKFELGQMVYLKSDPEQRERIVTQITVGGNMSIRYGLNCGTMETWHYDIELSTEKDQIKQFNDR